MLKIRLTDGTTFRWEQKDGLFRLSGDFCVAELARVKLDDIQFVEANGEEKIFIITNCQGIRYNARGTTRWIGEEARFIAVNLRNAANAEKKKQKKIERKKKQWHHTKQPFKRTVKSQK